MTYQGKYPVCHSKMESFEFLAVILSLILSGTVGTSLSPCARELYILYICTVDNIMVLYVSLYLQLVFMPCLVQVQWSSLRPTQLPLMCVELATSPSGVSMMGWRMCSLWGGILDYRQHPMHPTSQDTLPSLAPPPIRR